MFTNYYGQTKEQYNACRDQIDMSNQRTVWLVAVMFLFITAILGVVSFFYQGISQYRSSYITFSLLMGLFCLVTRVGRDMRKNVTLQMYVLITIVLLFGIVVCLINPLQKGTAYPVLLVLIPLLFIDRQIRMSLFLCGICLLNSILVLKYKNTVEAYYDIFGSISFGGISIIAHYFFNVKMMRSIVNEKNMQQVILAYKKAQEELRHKAEMDHLTGLYNRETFVEFVQKQMKQTEVERGMITLGILDVDHFKVINDTLGHQAGDDVIRQVSSVLKRTLRRDDLIGRLGGDEYIFLLNNVQDKEMVKRICERVLQALNHLETGDGIYVEASVGITMTNKRTSGFDELYNRADIALYKAKELGRNQFCFYEDYTFMD